jgi:sulfide:quinone oxidoreductase
MKIAQLTPSLSVSDQLRPEDLGLAASRGFKTVINNRPDGEEQGQPSSAAIASGAEALGLSYRHVPVVPGQLNDADVSAFRRALQDSNGPVLAFCRTGTRSTTLWALSQVGQMAPEAILGNAASAGYNLEPLRSTLERRAKRAVAWQG